MELRQRLTRWQNRMRNFRWGRRTNKQLLTVPNSDGDADNGRGVSTKKSRKNHTDVSAVDKSSSSSRPRYPIRWIKRSANSERLVDSDGTTSLSTSQDTIVNRTVQSVLSTNGLKAPRYAKLTSSATQENNHQSNSTEQSKIKLVPEKWNELTSVLR
ncbi:hypothetical protein FBUS_06457 [Fasciolopsis buskii]|uniref:Uncharacterized protein n=1 Tax=Fasciolopsis buskii TaxID=27845 RepID=A0A8E0RMB2_9TREM|nr:hypothetical protein FBUS_06457 [Fasciolopsis buski]